MHIQPEVKVSPMDSIPPPASTVSLFNRPSDAPHAASVGRASRAPEIRRSRPARVRHKVAVPYDRRPAAPSKTSLESGTILAGRYRVAFCLGSGGMCTVYLARDRRTRRYVAVKILHRELAYVPSMRRRFFNEVEAARRIRHPAVVRMFGIGELEDGRLYSSMEHVSGLSLRRRLERGPLPLREAVAVARALAGGLDAAHRVGVVHRDLKPGNILLPRSSAGPEAKILDFGIASLSDVSGMTGAMEILGTPMYISPEQARGKRADRRADIYALGAVMYEMITGARVFDGRTPAVLLNQHIDTPPVPMSRRRAGLRIPAPLEDLVMACLRKSPLHRPRTMGQVRAILSGLGPDGEYLN